ncbi:MAG: DUF736 domain-containing protein [Sphingomonadales bacterium]|nr:DUF736 domain-containing protein [Sphingomonadales bacterium]
MAVIGSFTETTSGFTGTIRTALLDLKVALVSCNAKANDTAPDYRLLAGDSEIGAAWQRQSKTDDARIYIAVKIDDPALPAPVHARLVQTSNTPGTWSLLWSR